MIERPRGGPRRTAFTLVELMVSTAVLALILLAIASLLNLTSSTYRRTSASLDSFETARAAFDALVRTAGRATLLSYIGYDDPTRPTEYGLKSDLHFLSGRQSEIGLAGTGADSTHAVFFQAPLGLAESATLQDADLLLNSTGFFLAYGDDPLRPAILNEKIGTRNRFRLYQVFEPRERMSVYDHTIRRVGGIPQSNESFGAGADKSAWFEASAMPGGDARPLADNVVAMAILPVSGDTRVPAYLWNSRGAAASGTRHMLPDALYVMVAAIDEKSAQRLGNGGAAPALYRPGLFTQPNEFENDLEKLEADLASHVPPLDFRIFTAEIPLNAASPTL